MHDAYQTYQTQTENRYKLHDGETLCPSCDGEGFVNGQQCERCGGDGVIGADEDEYSDKRKTGKSLFGSSTLYGHSDAADRTIRDERKEAYRLL